MSQPIICAWNFPNTFWTRNVHRSREHYIDVNCLMKKKNKLHLRHTSLDFHEHIDYEYKTKHLFDKSIRQNIRLITGLILSSANFMDKIPPTRTVVNVRVWVRICVLIMAMSSSRSEEFSMMSVCGYKTMLSEKCCHARMLLFTLIWLCFLYSANGGIENGLCKQRRAMNH